MLPSIRVSALHAGVAESVRAARLADFTRGAVRVLVATDLAARGHEIKKVPHLGGPCAMQTIRVLENGIRQAGSDPRRDGWAGAY
jgi:gamma-glutamyltranspeptidase